MADFGLRTSLAYQHGIETKKKRLGIETKKKRHGIEMKKEK